MGKGLVQLLIRFGLLGFLELLPGWSSIAVNWCLEQAQLCSFLTSFCSCLCFICCIYELCHLLICFQFLVLLEGCLEDSAFSQMDILAVSIGSFILLLLAFEKPTLLRHPPLVTSSAQQIRLQKASASSPALSSAPRFLSTFPLYL
jgi:hypothetical protein